MQQLYKRIPRHIGIIPDGNRRWAVEHNKEKYEGYDYGIKSGFQLYEICRNLGIQEISFYGFTQDNTKRPKIQTEAFQKACVDAVMELSDRDANLLVIGDAHSPSFPESLLPFANKRVCYGKGLININFLVNYSWSWDLYQAFKNKDVCAGKSDFLRQLGSSDIPIIDLIIRWGGRCRLSGFLPIQSVYSDFYIIDKYWPDFTPEQFYEALDWYQTQDITRGG